MLGSKGWQQGRLLLLLSCEDWQQGRLLLLLCSSKGRSLHLAAEARREKLLSLQASPLFMQEARQHQAEI